MGSNFSIEYAQGKSFQDYLEEYAKIQFVRYLNSLLEKKMPIENIFTLRTPISYSEEYCPIQTFNLPTYMEK